MLSGAFLQSFDNLETNTRLPNGTSCVLTFFVRSARANARDRTMVGAGHVVGPWLLPFSAARQSTPSSFGEI
jgi:hypothetical protein